MSGVAQSLRRPAVKICGITRPEDVDAAAGAGAEYIGFVFFAPSPRALSPARAAPLAQRAPAGLCKVGLFVDVDDATLTAILAEVPLDLLQLHGAETPDRVAGIRALTGLPVMKAVGIAAAEDLPRLDAHARAADMLLVDAKPPRGAALPGGNGLAFDWRLVAGRRWPVPWMLAGGLDARNVAEALRLTGAPAVDVSSGVEASPGVKDPARIADFLAAVGRAGPVMRSA
ncbi:MAG: phosphoribosylanthranilate isomerase [Rhodobacteraceae bacterium]|nr:phosphoribosylanthranilate isomerase [Paracoccaceae bacterium]